MRKSYRFLVVAFGLVSILSNPCKSQSTEIRFTKFPQTFQLKGTRVNIKEIFRVGMVSVYDSVLIISNTAESENQFHIYDRKSFKYLGSSGKVGRGPSEIVNPGLATLDSKKGVFWFLDFGSRKIWKFNIERMVKVRNYLPESFVPMPNVFVILFYYPFRDNLFSFIENDPKKLISFFNEKGEILDSLAIPDKINFYKPEELKLALRDYNPYYLYTFHPSLGKAVIANRFSDILVIIDLKGNILRKVYGPNNNNQVPNPANNDLIKTYYNTISSDDNFIYCLYLNKKSLNEQQVSNSPNKILVYNWDGKPIAEINLEFTTGSFVIDKGNNRIVSYSTQVDDLVYYDLPKLKMN